MEPIIFATAIIVIVWFILLTTLLLKGKEKIRRAEREGQEIKKMVENLNHE